MKLIKKFIIPIIVIALFIIGYFIIYPKYLSNNASKDIFTSFEKGLNDLKIDYKKEEIDAKEFGAKKAYIYTTEESRVMLYIFSKNAEEYKKGVANGHIVSNKYADSKLYGTYMNNCVLYMEDKFPNDAEVLNLFINISKKYSDNI